MLLCMSTKWQEQSCRRREIAIFRIFSGVVLLSGDQKTLMIESAILDFCGFACNISFKMCNEKRKVLLIIKNDFRACNVVDYLLVY